MRIVRNTAVYLQRFVKKEINLLRLRPTNVLLFLTYRCTSRCKSCTMWRRTSTHDELSISELLRFVDMLDGLPVESVELFGGDALLRKDAVIAVTRAVRARGVPRVELVTNGNLLDEGAAEELVAAGVNVFTISVDGVGELHDYVRGTKGSFDRIRKVVAAMVKNKNGKREPRIAINCTVSALNIYGFEKVLPFADEIGADTVSFEYVGEFPPACIERSRVNGYLPEPFFVPQGRSILLTREQAALLKQKMSRLKEDARGRRVYMNSYNIDFLRLENLISGELPNRRCCICRYMIIADPYGNMLPCPFFNTYHIGNLRQRHLRDIWGNEMHRSFIQNIDVSKVDLCKRCILGVERNPTFLQSIHKAFLKYSLKGLDEPTDTGEFVPHVSQEGAGA